MKICMVSSGFDDRKIRLQPFPYLMSLVNELSLSGQEVTLLSTKSGHNDDDNNYHGFPISRINRIWSFSFSPNSELISVLDMIKPEIIFWHIGLTSFLHFFDIPKLDIPIIGVMTSPIYKLHDFKHIDIWSFIKGCEMTIPQIIGSLIPSNVFLSAQKSGKIKGYIVESNTMKEKLSQKCKLIDKIYRVYPTISEEWLQPIVDEEKNSKRLDLGFTNNDLVIGFWGPPAYLRGLPQLISAIFEARKTNSNLKLLIVSRRRTGEYEKENRYIQKLINKFDGELWIKNITGFLAPNELKQIVSVCDIVSIPLELVPSDMPLSILEALALGIPVVSTRVFSIPEIVPPDCGICVRPGNIYELANAINVLAEDYCLRLKMGENGRKHITSWLNSRSDFNNWNSLLTLFAGYSFDRKFNELEIPQINNEP